TPPPPCRGQETAPCPNRTSPSPSVTCGGSSTALTGNPGSSITPIREAEGDPGAPAASRSSPQARSPPPSRSSPPETVRVESTRSQQRPESRNPVPATTSEGVQP